MLNERRAQEEKYSRINRLKILNQWRGSRAEIASWSCHSLRPQPPRTQGLGPERAPRTLEEHPSRPGPSGSMLCGGQPVPASLISLR